MTSPKGSRAFYKVWFPGPRSRGIRELVLKCKVPGPAPT